MQVDVGLEGASPLPLTWLALQRLSNVREPRRRPTRWPGGRRSLPCRPAGKDPHSRPTSSVLAASPLALCNRGDYHHSLPPNPGHPLWGLAVRSEQQHLWLAGHGLMTVSQRRYGRPGLTVGWGAATPRRSWLAPTPETRRGHKTPGSSRDSLLLELEESGFDLGLGVL